MTKERKNANEENSQRQGRGIEIPLCDLPSQGDAKEDRGIEIPLCDMPSQGDASDGVPPGRPTPERDFNPSARASTSARARARTLKPTTVTRLGGLIELEVR